MPQWQVCPQSERSSVPRGRSGSSLHRHRVSQSLSMGAFLTRWPSRPKIYATNVRIPDNRDTRGRNAVVDSLRLRSCATYGLVARAIGRLHRCMNQIFSAGPAVEPQGSPVFCDDPDISGSDLSTGCSLDGAP